MTEIERTLLDRAKAVLAGNIEFGDQYIWGQKRLIVPSRGPYLGGWNWDSAFHANTVSRWDPELAYEQVEVFLDQQCENGKLPDAIWGWDNTVFDRITKPPVFPWAFVRVYQRKPDKKRLERAYQAFVKNESFWTTLRKEGELFHYDCDALDDDWLKYSKYESGWDTSPRWDNGCRNLWPVDLNCFMVDFYKALAFMAEKLQLEAEATAWREKSKVLAEAINRVLWNEQQKIYLDYDYEKKQHSPVMSPACFMPLFVGIASADRAEALARHASDPNTFYPAIPTVSFDDKEYASADYWRGPTWLNTLYFTVKGLYDYGYRELALRIKDNILQWCADNEDTIYEYYDSKTGKGLGAEGFGWSSCFIIELICEIQ